MQQIDLLKDFIKGCFGKSLCFQHAGHINYLPLGTVIEIQNKLTIGTSTA